MKYPYNECNKNLVFFLRQLWLLKYGSLFDESKGGTDLSANEVIKELGLLEYSREPDDGAPIFRYPKIEYKDANPIYLLMIGTSELFLELMEHSFNNVETALDKIFVGLTWNKAKYKYLLIDSDSVTKSAAEHELIHIEDSDNTFYEDQILLGSLSDITREGLSDALVSFYIKNKGKLGYWVITPENKEKASAFKRSPFGSKLDYAGLIKREDAL